MNIRVLIMTTFSFISKLIGRRGKRIGISPGQPKVFDYLVVHDGASQTDIARSCGLEASTLTPILDGMEKEGYIERRKVENDRRTYHVFLTVLGREKAAQVIALFEHIEEDILKGLNEDEREEFKRMLQIVHDNAKKQYLDFPGAK